MAQSVRRLTLSLFMISRFVSPSPASGSVLTAQSLEPASDSVSPSLSVPLPLTLCLSLSKIKVKKKKKRPSTSGTQGRQRRQGSKDHWKSRRLLG